MRVALVFLAILALAIGRSVKDNRIAGGAETTIEQYPYSVAVLYSSAHTGFQKYGGGIILNQRSVLTAASIFDPCCSEGRQLRCNTLPSNWHSRVGSSFVNEGGTIHRTSHIITHSLYDPNFIGDNDIAIIRLASFINYIPNVVGPARLAGENYSVADNQPVTAIGWGIISPIGPLSMQLRHVQIWTVNRELCNERYYAEVGVNITENMVCAGWLGDADGRGQCTGDNGSPLLHTDVVIGVHTLGIGCGHSVYPGFNTLVSRYIQWIRANS